MTRISVLGLGMVAAGLFAAPASAKELTFYFDVFSSGPEIYPCDAGIIHPKQADYCHYKGTATSCKPAELGKAPGQTLQDVFGKEIKAGDLAHACICTSSGGNELMDYAKFKARKWHGTYNGTTDCSWGDPHAGWAVQPVIGTIKGAPSTHPDYGSVRTVTQAVHGDTTIRDVPKEFQTQLEEVTFYLGTELYGAHYFVDLCFRGPQIPYNADGVDAPFASTSWIQVTDGNLTGRSYLNVAKPKVEGELVCDLQGAGTFTGPSGFTNAMAPDATFGTDIKDSGSRYTAPAGLNDSFDYATKWIGKLSGDFLKVFDGNGSLVVTQQTWLVGNATTSVPVNTVKKQVPRFCKARYYFYETNANAERAWQLHDARFFMKWKVWEEAQADAPTTLTL